MNFLLKATGLKEKNSKTVNSNIETNNYCSAPDAKFPVIAGQSVLHFTKTDSTDNTWSEETDTVFELRIGPDYNRFKNKAPSAAPIFELLAMDLFRSQSKIDSIGSKITLPQEWTADEFMNTNSSHIPPLFIVNVQIPAELSTNLLSMFENITDGPGFSIVYYYRLTKESVEALKDINHASPGLKCFEEYCKNAPFPDIDNPDEPWRSRFKVITQCTNMDEFGYPGFITSYNGKPVLIRTTGTVTKGSTFIEMDINVHNFGTLARKGMDIMFENFSNMIIDVGFCIEGRLDSELPEVLLGKVHMNKPNYAKAVNWTGPM